MQAYIGCKVILAEECCKEAFDAAKKDGFKDEASFNYYPSDASADLTPGYHVVYSNPDGSKYHSWSPRDQFQRAYRRIETDEKELISTY